VLAWRALATEDGPLYYIGAFFAVAAQAVWSANHLTVERLPTGLVMYAAFGVLSLAVPVLARWRQRPLTPQWLSGAVLLASLALLLFLTQGSVAAAALWGLALLLAFLNAAIFIESAGAALPIVSLAGGSLSWFVLLSWLGRAARTVAVEAWLLVIVGMALMMFGGHAWARRHASTAPVQRPAAAGGYEGLLRFSSGLRLGLVAHVLLFAIAAAPEWALPPWPLFGALAVVVLAASTTALAERMPSLHMASTAAAGIVLLGWSTVARDTGWATVTMAAHALLAGFALAWIQVSRRPHDRGIAAMAAAAALVAAELTLVHIALSPDAAPLALRLTAHVAFLSVLLALAAAFNWRYGASATAVLAAYVVFTLGDPPGMRWGSLLAHGVALYLPFAVYPLALGRRGGDNRDPYLAAIVASVWSFFALRVGVMESGYGSMVGIVPVALGAVAVLHLRVLLRIQPAGGRDLGRLALVAGTALGFMTVAIPLQLRQQWMTIGWALEGAAVAWLYRRIPHRGLLSAAVALLGAVFVRLAFNPQVLIYEPRGEMRILNWYLYAYVVCAAAMFAAAWWLSKTDDTLAAFGRLPRPRHLLVAAGGILLFLLLNIEIADFYATGPQVMFRFGATLAQDLTYTIGWLVFGMATLAAGIIMKARPARIAAVALITVTTLKCFLYDFGSLGGLYRVGAFVGLAVSLALVSLALQKYVLQPAKEGA
jgi:hypothetical protein